MKLSPAKDIATSWSTPAPSRSSTTATSSLLSTTTRRRSCIWSLAPFTDNKQESHNQESREAYEDQGYQCCYRHNRLHCVATKVPGWDAHSLQFLVHLCKDGACGTRLLDVIMLNATLAMKQTENLGLSNTLELGLSLNGSYEDAPFSLHWHPSNGTPHNWTFVIVIANLDLPIIVELIPDFTLQS